MILHLYLVMKAAYGQYAAADIRDTRRGVVAMGRAVINTRKIAVTWIEYEMARKT
jgi:hypothetical protein